MIDTTSTVVLKPGFLLEQFDNELTLYHPTGTTAVYLNETGALVWELCDNRRTTEDFIEILARRYPESRDAIAREVPALIKQLVDNRIAELSPA
jgi:hypothetical protein